MRRSIIPLAMLAAAMAACSGSSGAGTPTTQTDDPVQQSCDADVTHANLNVRDVEALDFAIHDCGTLARLKATVARKPGYLDPAVTTLEEFAANRCQYATVLTGTPICRELGVSQ